MNSKQITDVLTTGASTNSVSTYVSLFAKLLDCGEGGHDECMLSVSLKGSSLTIISVGSLVQAVFMEIAGKHSSSISTRNCDSYSHAFQ